MSGLYLEDIKVGDSWQGPPFLMTGAEIVAFASAFDPQPMHCDPVAAGQGRFGGIIASGWHLLARVMREYVDLSPFGDTPMLGMRVDDLCWHKPVRPGDTIHVRREIIEVKRSRSKPDRGTILTLTTVSNQDGVVVMSFKNLVQMPARESVPA
ncbi:MAG: MaoC family dehydratase [Zavarzinia sp.]|nr:MaoC family dehydratase [Zavarzinia sp.]